MSDTLSWRQGPVTALFIAIATFFFLLIHVLRLPGMIPWLTFLPVEIVAGQVVFYEMGQQYWRLISPIFLHFGWLHIAFNGLWLWELGGRMERQLGSFNMFGLFLVPTNHSSLGRWLHPGRATRRKDTNVWG